MVATFDTVNGEVYIGNLVTLRAGLTGNELTKAGLVFTHELDMMTGWVFRITGPIHMAGHELQLSLGFHEGVLKKASFGFTEDPGLDMGELFNEHNTFLRDELGEPHGQDVRHIVYRYGWGEIVSEYDPRGGESSIWVGWR